MSFEIDIDLLQGDFRLVAAFHSSARITALMGRSGSGKTTLVNAIAGLVRPQRGRIVVDGIVLLDTANGICVPAHRRRAGYVFQEGRLFSHLTVKQNLMFGRWFSPRGAAEAEPDHVIELLGIGHLLRRRPVSLSGGEKQRVAIARALLASPRILLMDEPLAALDDARKAEILPYIERLRDETRIPVIYVTHSASEAARLAEEVVVLEAGGVAAQGLASAVLAGEGGTVLEARVLGHDPAAGLTRVRTAAGDLSLPLMDLPPGASVRIGVKIAG